MMNVLKPTSLLLALRMRQLPIPLDLFDYNIFILKYEFLQALIILRKTQNCQSLVENQKRTSKYKPME